MSDKPETLAAILAEMRASSLSTVRAWADRIETAAERERNAHTNDIHDALYMATGIPGNAAAMREALERIVEWADRYVGRLCFHGPSPERDGWRAASHAANDALAQARDALSAPARNCDRFDNYLDARAEYDGNLGSEEWRFGAWLFAKAQGGDHA